jgi:hypothetical protein
MLLVLLVLVVCFLLMLIHHDVVVVVVVVVLLVGTVLQIILNHGQSVIEDCYGFLKETIAQQDGSFIVQVNGVLHDDDNDDDDDETGCFV